MLTCSFACLTKLKTFSRCALLISAPILVPCSRGSPILMFWVCFTTSLVKASRAARCTNTRVPLQQTWGIETGLRKAPLSELTGSELTCNHQLIDKLWPPLGPESQSLNKVVKWPTHVVKWNAREKAWALQVWWGRERAQVFHHTQALPLPHQGEYPQKLWCLLLFSLELRPVSPVGWETSSLRGESLQHSGRIDLKSGENSSKYHCSERLRMLMFTNVFASEDWRRWMLTFVSIFIRFEIWWISFNCIERRRNPSACWRNKPQIQHYLTIFPDSFSNVFWGSWQRRFQIVITGHL